MNCVSTINLYFGQKKRQEQHPQTVEQAWFAGAHSNVGGGYKQRGLSDLSLKWMIEQAKKIGLTFKESEDKIQGDESEVIETSRLDFPWRCSYPVIRDIKYPRYDVKPDIQDCIYAHPSVKKRLERLTTTENREKLLYHREPDFEKVDNASKHIPTRYERLREIAKRKDIEEKMNLIKELKGLASDPRSGGVYVGETRVTFNGVPIKIKRR